MASKGAMTPPVSSTLTVGRDFSDATVNPTNSNASLGNRPSVSCDPVIMDLGGFLEQFIGPLAQQLSALPDPLRPIVDVLTASIGVPEDFPVIGATLDRTGDGRATLPDVLKPGFPGVDLAPFMALLDRIGNVTGRADFLETTGFGKADLISGDVGLGTADIRPPGFNLTDTVGKVVGKVGGIGDSLDDVLAPRAGRAGPPTRAAN